MVLNRAPIGTIYGHVHRYPADADTPLKEMCTLYILIMIKIV